MSAPDSNLLVLVLYRLASMLIGLAALYMGYRLFLSGFFEHAGDLKAAWGGNALEVKQAAPGTVFGLLGAVVIVVSLWKGLSITPARSRVSYAATPDSATVAAWQGERAALAIAGKAVRGESLTDAERATFRQWYERAMQRLDMRSFDVRIAPGSSSVFQPH